jgi:membrane peptidoglycan carboxypeptidase
MGMQEGFAPQSILFDTATEFSTNSSCPSIPDFSNNNKNCFHPVDFEGTFAGPVSIRDALAQSINVPAVKMLYMVGLNSAIKTLNNFGLTTLTDPNSYGLSLVLGGGAVRLIDLVKTYSVLADDGIKHDQSMILKVQDSNGNILESYTDNNVRVSDSQSVRLINNILSDANARQPLYQNSLQLTVFPGYQVALKTGTSNDYRDTWAMGYTPSLVAGVWAGNNDNSPLQRNGSSILAAVPIWHEFMNLALQSSTPQLFPDPAPVNPTKPLLDGQYIINGQVHSELYYINTSDPTGPDPVNPYSDPQYKNWEVGVQNWARSRGL